jgi:hypothetical protein
MEDISGDDMPNIDRISGVGVRVPRLPMYTTSLEETSAVYYTPLLQRLFASIPQVPPALGSSALEVFSTMDQYTAASVFSAVLSSRSIRDMRVAKSSRDMAPPSIAIWPWLALSVFSRFATNRLECVTIDITNLSIEDVAAIESIVRAPNPLGAFFKDQHQTEAFAIASRFWFSTNAGERPDLFLGTDTLEVRDRLTIDKKSGSASFCPAMANRGSGGRSVNFRPTYRHLLWHTGHSKRSVCVA